MGSSSIKTASLKKDDDTVTVATVTVKQFSESVLDPTRRRWPKKDAVSSSCRIRVIADIVTTTEENRMSVIARGHLPVKCTH